MKSNKEEIKSYEMVEFSSKFASDCNSATPLTFAYYWTIIALRYLDIALEKENAEDICFGLLKGVRGKLAELIMEFLERDIISVQFYSAPGPDVAMEQNLTLEANLRQTQKSISAAAAAEYLPMDMFEQLKWMWYAMWDGSLIS